MHQKENRHGCNMAATSETKEPNYNSRPLNFKAVNARAIPLLPAVLNRILPGGKVCGGEYVALNPRRLDTRLGSFKINLRTGIWSDFAAGAAGGDVSSLIAYVQGISQSEALKLLASMIGGAP